MTKNATRSSYKVSTKKWKSLYFIFGNFYLVNLTQKLNAQESTSDVLDLYMVTSLFTMKINFEDKIDMNTAVSQPLLLKYCRKIRMRLFLTVCRVIRQISA